MAELMLRIFYVSMFFMSWFFLGRVVESRASEKLLDDMERRLDKLEESIHAS